jgi:hypothetical protein
MIARRGAGPEPYVFHGTSQTKSPTDEFRDPRIKYKDLNSENLAMAFRQALSEEARSAAHDMGSFIRDEVSRLATGYNSLAPLLIVTIMKERG